MFCTGAQSLHSQYVLFAVPCMGLGYDQIAGAQNNDEWPSYFSRLAFIVSYKQECTIVHVVVLFIVREQHSLRPVIYRGPRSNIAVIPSLTMTKGALTCVYIRIRGLLGLCDASAVIIQLGFSGPKSIPELGAESVISQT